MIYMHRNVIERCCWYGEDEMGPCPRGVQSTRLDLHADEKFRRFDRTSPVEIAVCCY